MTNVVLYDISEEGVATITINRPEVHNAFNDEVISLLKQHFETAANDETIRVIVLRSNGKNFSAGADLKMMKESANNSRQDNVDNARKMGGMFHFINKVDKPVICLIQGSAFGGALGLVACCDIAIATKDACFCLSEVKLGLCPAVISPFVVAAIGERSARRYFLSAEKFDANQAQKIGLIHDTVDSVDQLDEKLSPILKTLLGNGPRAIARSKELIRNVDRKDIDSSVLDYTAAMIADIRVTEEGQEGLAAFFEKRKPNWVKN